MDAAPPRPFEQDSVELASRHALGWLVFGNAIGLLLAVLLLEPEWQPGRWTYGHWVPLHLNAQLYGWTALPLVAWLLSMYQVEHSSARAWGAGAVWAWTAALAFSCFRWLSGETSGKIFLDWRNASLWSFLVALVLLWLVLARAWKDRGKAWSKVRRVFSLAGLAVLAAVPLVMVAAASPRTYPPVDRTTGGPTGSSLLGSTLVVVCLMLMLPRMAGLAGGGKAGRGTWCYLGVSWVAFGITEAAGGGHFDAWQIGAMLMLLPWAVLIPWDWSGFSWRRDLLPWRWSMLIWWGVLVATGVAMYSPGILDRLKFTQGLVAHSHLAMAGFTTSFCMVLIGLITGRSAGGILSVIAWNLAVATMILVLASLGWREGASAEWMALPAPWRWGGLAVRAGCGAVMLAVSISWLKRSRPI